MNNVETNPLPGPNPCGYPYEFDLRADHANKRCELELKKLSRVCS